MFTDLERATMMGDEDDLRSELENSSDINTMGNLGYSPLQLACTLKNEKIVDIILDFKPAMNIKSSCNDTALNLFVKLFPPNVRLLKRFLEEGADPNMVDPRGRTALHLAVYRSDSEIIEKYIPLLLQYKADLHSKDNYGHTPMHQAILNGSDVAVEILLLNGALTNNKNLQDETELDLAVLNNYEYPTVMQLIGRYLIVQDILTKDVDPADINLICSIEKYSVFKGECDSEVEASKTITLGDSTVTCYDVFSSLPDNLAEKLRYRNVPISMMTFDKKSFPIFGNLLERRLRFSVERFRAIDAGYEFLRKLCPEIPSDCVDVIVSFLTNTDLINLKLV